MSSQVVDFNNTESGSTHVDDYWVQIQVCCHTDLTDLTSLGIRAMFGDQCKIDLLLSSLLVSLNMKKCSMKTYLRVREGQRGRERERERLRHWSTAGQDRPDLQPAGRHVSLATK